MTNPDPARVAALKAQLAAISAELDELTADDTPQSGDYHRSTAAAGVELTNPTFAEMGLTEKPQRQSIEDAREAARRRHPGCTRSEVASAVKAAGNGDGDASGQSQAALGRAEAQRRLGRR